MSPRPKWQHQRAMMRLASRSIFELERKGLEILPEATVTDDWDDLAPDLVIFNGSFEPLSIIEITRSYQLNAIVEKCEELMERFPYAEYFVYDYEEEVLYQYDSATNQWVSSVEYELYSQYLNRPLLDYIKS